MRNGFLYLLFRISDLRKHTLLEAHVRMILIQNQETEEGEVIPYQVKIDISLNDLILKCDINYQGNRIGMYF